MKIRFTSLSARFYEHDGWSWEDIKNIAAKDTRIIYFNDIRPYWVIDRINTQVLLSYKLPYRPEYSSVFKEDEGKSLEQLIEERDL